MIGLTIPLKPTTTNKIIKTIRYSFIITTVGIVWIPIVSAGYTLHKLENIFTK